jgi:PAS domain S-box-containing protein
MQFDNGIYLNIINSCKDCIFICNKEGKILFFNKSFSEKYKDKAHQEANIRDIFPEKIYLSILQIFEKDIKLNKTFNFTEKTENAEYEISVEIISHERNENIACVTYRENLNKNEEINQSDKSYEAYRTIIELAPDAYFRGDKEGNFIDCNLKAEEITGYTKNELLTKNIKELFEKEELVNKPLQYSLLQKGTPLIRQRTIFRKDGKKVDIEMNSSILPDGTYQTFIRDITHTRELEKILKERIKTLTKPEIKGEDIKFKDLFDIDEIQKIQDAFAKVTGVASLITDTKGVPITKPSNFCFLCEHIIRKTEKGIQNCIKSDAELGKYITDKPNIMKCYSVGFWEGVANIKAGNYHIANWLIGQVIDEKDDINSFLKYAKEIGVDEEEFKKALLSVTRMPKEKFDEISHALFLLADQLSKQALKNLQQARYILELEQKEKQIKTAEEKLRLALEATNDGLWEWYPQENKVIWNSRSYTMLGYEPDEFDLCYEKWIELLHPEDREKAGKEVLKQIISEEKKFSIEYRYLTKNNSWIWINGRGKVIRDDENGNPLYIIGTHTDITDRKIAENALRESEEKYRKVVETSSEGIILQDDKFIIHTLNPAAERILGIKAEKIINKSSFEEKWQIYDEKNNFLPTEKHPSSITLMTGKPCKNVILKVIRADKSYSWINVNTKPIFTENNDKPALVVITLSDITERKFSEEALKNLASQWQTTFDAIGDGVCLIDKNQVIIRCNKAMREMFNYKHTDIVGEKCYKIVHNKDVPIDNCPVNIMLITKKRSSTEVFIDSKWYEVTVDPLFDSDKEIIGAVHIVRDISSQKKYETEIKELNQNLEIKVEEKTRELQLANKELESFAYSVSHDLRAPLRAISGFSKILEQDYGLILDNEGKRLIKIINDNTKKMGNLIDDLLTFSRFGRNEMKFNQLNTSSIVKSVIEDVHYYMNCEKTKFIINELPDIKGDQTMIYQVWYNLISNAVKFSSKVEKPEIVIEGKAEKSFVTFSVKDNGIGFDMKYSQKLFGVFQRLHNDYDFEGTGVGLAIVQRIINRHGGKIWAYSELGKGATFYFSLPIIKD